MKFLILQYHYLCILQYPQRFVKETGVYGVWGVGYLLYQQKSLLVETPTMGRVRGHCSFSG